MPRPISRPICPVRPNSIASITPLLREPFGPEIANVPGRSRKDLHKVIGLQLLRVGQRLCELFDLAGVNVLRLRQLRQELFGYLLLKCRHIAS